MCFHVLIKVLFHVEVLATPLAHELLVPDVDAHVGTQLVLVLEPLVAVLQEKISRCVFGCPAAGSEVVVCEGTDTCTSARTDARSDTEFVLFNERRTGSALNACWQGAGSSQEPIRRGWHRQHSGSAG